MVWVVETPVPAPRKGALLFHLLRAELRQFWWLPASVLASGFGVWALLVAVTARVPTEARPEGVVFNYSASLLLSVFPLLLTAPVMAAAASPGRLGLWLGLPVSRGAVNLVRILGLVVNLWPAALTWPLIIALLERVYGPVSIWVIINSALVLGLGILLATRTRFAPFIIFIATPLQMAISYFVPGGQPIAEFWARIFASPWAGLAILAAGIGLAMFTLTSHPGRRTL